MRPVHLDVTDSNSIAKAAAWVRATREGSPLRALVNNAGITVAAPLEFVPIEKLRLQLEVNVTGHVAVTQALLPQIREAPVRRIVFIGSTSGFISAPLQGPYCASKHAIEAICDTFRLELKPWGIGVSCVQPGQIKTPIWEKSTDAANAWLEEAPDVVHRLYDPLIDKVRRFAESAADNAAPVEVVVRDVEHAIFSNRPRTRYLNGEGARIQKILSKLPDRWRDAIMERFLSL